MRVQINGGGHDLEYSTMDNTKTEVWIAVERGFDVVGANLYHGLLPDGVYNLEFRLLAF